MKYIFGKTKTPEQIMRENQRSLKKVIRELEREQKKCEADEKKLITDIKKAAKIGQEESVKIMARDLVRNRAFVKKFMIMKANIQAISLKLTTLKSTQAMSTAMKEVGKTLKVMNKQMNIPALQKILMGFEKESAVMELKDEMMNDALDDAMEADDEEDMDKIVNQVFDELGIEMNSKLAFLETPGNSELKKTENSGKMNAPSAVGGIDENDLEARLANLKKI